MFFSQSKCQTFVYLSQKKWQSVIMGIILLHQYVIWGSSEIARLASSAQCVLAQRSNQGYFFGLCLLQSNKWQSVITRIIINNSFALVTHLFTWRSSLVILFRFFLSKPHSFFFTSCLWHSRLFLINTLGLLFNARSPWTKFCVWSTFFILNI